MSVCFAVIVVAICPENAIRLTAPYEYKKILQDHQPGDARVTAII